MRIDAMIFADPSMSAKEQKEFAYMKVEDTFMVELSDAERREDVHDILYSELNSVIEQYGLDLITADSVIPEFYKVWGLRV